MQQKKRIIASIVCADYKVKVFYYENDSHGNNYHIIEYTMRADKNGYMKERQKTLNAFSDLKSCLLYLYHHTNM